MIWEITIQFFTLRMPDLNGYIPGYVFYNAVLSEFIRIAKCISKLSDFAPEAKELILRIMNQGVNQVTSLKQIQKQ